MNEYRECDLNKHDLFMHEKIKWLIIFQNELMDVWMNDYIPI